MSQALNEFQARIRDLRSDIAFVTAATKFRPYALKAIDRTYDPYAVELATIFTDIKDSHIEGFLGPLAVRLAGSTERYLRAIIEESIITFAKKAKKFADVPPAIAKKNLILTGRLLASSENPREHLRIDVELLARNLATCTADRKDFVLNHQAFGTLVYGVSDDAIGDCLEAIVPGNLWTLVGADSKVQGLLAQTRPVDAAKASKQRFSDLSRWRNNWAHGGDDEVSLTDEQLIEMCNFVQTFIEVLDEAINARRG